MRPGDAEYRKAQDILNAERSRAIYHLENPSHDFDHEDVTEYEYSSPILDRVEIIVGLVVLTVIAACVVLGPIMFWAWIVEKMG